MKGMFITFEGTEGAGKSVQSRLLKHYLEAEGREVLLTREPGGAPISEKIREIILDKNNTEMTDMTEALLYAAARSQHVSQVIRPALQKGVTVICDRYLDSSIVYQGIARGLGIDTVRAINSYAVNGVLPDITFFLKLSPEVGLKRKARDGEFDRLELEDGNFHETVYNGYQRLSAIDHNRIRTIDAGLSKEIVHGIIVDNIKKML